MKVQRLLFAACVSAVAWVGNATASLDGSGSILVIPIVAQTASFATEVTVRNPYTFALAVAVDYAGGTGTAASGYRSCGSVAVPASSTIQFSVGPQCALPAGSNFGRLTLRELGAFPSPIQAYSRVSNPQGIGFSVPAFPAGALEAPVYGHFAVGLKRQAAAPTFQTNCFVSATDESTPYQIRLLDAGGAQLGSAIAGMLSANQLIRFLDIFAAAGLASGDYANVTAEFSAPGSNGAAFIGFCTVQDNTSFGADFRIAQPYETRDGSRQRFLSGSLDTFYVASSINMTRHPFFFRHPDWVRCRISSLSAAFLELRVVSPTPEAAVAAGGNNVTDTGTFYIGPRSAYAGFSGLWFVDVSPRETYFGSFPVYYTLECFSGNGGATPETPIRTLDAF